MIGAYHKDGDRFVLGCYVHFVSTVTMKEWMEKIKIIYLIYRFAWLESFRLSKTIRCHE